MISSRKKQVIEYSVRVLPLVWILVSMYLFWHKMFGYFFRVMPLLWISASVYVFWHGKEWSRKHFVVSRRARCWVFWSYVVVNVYALLLWVMMSVLGRQAALLPSFWMRVFVFFPSYVIVVTQCSITCLLFASDVGYVALRLGRRLVNLVMLSMFWPVCSALKRRGYAFVGGPAKPVDEERRSFLKKTAIALPVGVFSLNVIGVVASEYDLLVTKVSIPVQSFPDALRGLKITHISDFHFGPFMDLERFVYFAKEINALQSDMIVITGDFINNSVHLLPMVLEAVRLLRAPLGIYSCLGNHEYYTGISRSMAALRRAPMKLLVNQAERLEYRGTALYVLGIDYPMISKKPSSVLSMVGSLGRIEEDLDQTLRSVDPEVPKILLAHHPDTFYVSSQKNIELTLSGHTHGGHVVFSPWGHEWSSLFKPIFHYVKGHYTKDSSHLYVNSGLGHWFPVRLNCPVEITQLVLE